MQSRSVTGVATLVVAILLTVAPMLVVSQGPSVVSIDSTALQTRKTELKEGGVLVVLYILESANNTEIEGDLARIDKILGSTGTLSLTTFECKTLDNCGDAKSTRSLPQMQIFLGDNTSPRKPYILERDELTYRAMMTFVLSMGFAQIRQPDATIEATSSAIDELRKSDRVIVGFFKGASGPEYDVWRRHASQYAAETDLMEVTDPVVAEALGVTEFPRVLAFKGDDVDVLRKDDYGVHSLLSFIEEAGVRTAARMEPNTLQKVAIFGIPGVILFTKPGEANGDSVTVKDFTRVSEDRLLNDHLLFVYEDGEKAGKFRETLGVAADALPAVVILDPSQELGHYLMDSSKDGVNVDSLRAFLQQYDEGELSLAPPPPPPPPPAPVPPPASPDSEGKQGGKSAPIPEGDEGPLWTVVLDSFTSFVLDETQDVFVEFYYPWCGHCKKLEPTWKELAESYKDVDGVKIAKFDMVANDAPSMLGIKGAPTLILFPAKDKGGFVKFEGKRELRKFQVFVSKHGSNNIPLPKKELEPLDELPSDVAEHLPEQRARIEAALRNTKGQRGAKEDL